MAREVIVRITDDVDRYAIRTGTAGKRTHPREATEEVELTYQGHVYRWDLTVEHAHEFTEALAPWLEAAHTRERAPRPQAKGAPKAPTPPVKPRTKKKPPATAERAVIRDWGRKNGHPVAERGIVPAAVVNAYHAAHPSALRLTNGVKV